MKTPMPTSKDDRKRWRITGRRHRMLTGNWRRDAEERIAEFFDPDVSVVFRSVDLSHNALKVYSSQLNTLYKTEPAVSTIHGDDLEPLGLDRLWPQQQQTGLLVLGCNEALVRLDWSERGGMRYSTVAADSVASVVTDPATGEILSLEHLQQRSREAGDGKQETVWAWDVWDVRDPANPVFRILEADEDGERKDVTSEFYDGDGYPYQDAEGPIMPYVLYHRRAGQHTFSPHEGGELVDGTLQSAAYWTFLGAIIRDSGNPIRVLINGKLEGTTTEQGRQERLTISPFHIQQITDHSGNARIEQFPPGADVSMMADALTNMDMSLAVHAGLSPSDVARGSSGQSGYAIVVKQQGLRDIQASLVPPTRQADRQTLSRAARMVNAYQDGVSGLPTDPSAYLIEYHQIGESSQEREARVAADRAETDAGYRHPTEGWIARHPGTTREEAEEQMLEAARFKAALAAVSAAPAVQPPEPEDDPAQEDPADG